ncbi:sensor histidine kinase [Cohnella herbarum]|uniref:Histidine kinase n=1 Tax=Cohnella herbarum TaxID=2728023 RepID=A0A7Z2VNS9_9BACL|nr:sensor histidine kinase [Cohnella herbarum]QJD86428.1 histidine kinase [Cohnella herbarum]
MFKHFHLQTQLFALYSCIILGIVVLAFSLLNDYFSKTFEQRAVENMEQLTLKTSDQVDSLLKGMDGLALQIATNPVTQDVFVKRAKSDPVTGNYFLNHLIKEREVKDLLASINGPQMSVMRMSLFNDKEDYVEFGSKMDNPSSIVQRLASGEFQQWYADSIEKSGPIVIPPHSDYWSESEERVISVVRGIRDIVYFETNGFVEVQQPYSKLQALLQLDKTPDVQVYLLSREGTLLGDPDERLSRIYQQEMNLASGNLRHFYNPVHDRYELASFHRSAFSGWTLALVQDERTLFAPLRTLRQTLLISSIAVLSVTMALIFFITRRLTKPLKQLTRSLRKVNMSNLSIDIRNDHNQNDIHLLNKAFGQMFDRLKNSMDLVIQSQAQEFKAQQKALQSQMNPHFLYNTLSVISAVGDEAGVYKVMEMCHKLSNMLRYTTSFDDRDVTIRQEWKHAQDYLELMKERYEHQFVYEMAADESGLDIPIPKLILQPLIENCFQHGFKQTQPPWRIEVTAGVNGNRWYITVGDNGTGFDSIQLDSIMAKWRRLEDGNAVEINQLKLGGLGLYNTVVRLYMQFGHRMIFQVEPNSPSGTKITIGGDMTNDTGYGR